jgi:hypothetical protein
MGFFDGFSRPAGADSAASQKHDSAFDFCFENWIFNTQPKAPSATAAAA